MPSLDAAAVGLSIHKTGRGLIAVEWDAPGYTLQLAYSALGPWYNVTNATSPYYTTGQSMTFFRLNNGSLSTNTVALMPATWVPTYYYLIENPFDARYVGGNAVSNVLNSVPDGTSLSKWSTDTHSFISNYFSSSSGWTDSTMSLAPGEGAFVHMPPGTLDFKTIFLGEVMQSYGASPLSVELVPGFNLIGSKAPVIGNLAEPSWNYTPNEGDQVYHWNASAQAYESSQFSAGFGWDPPLKFEQVGNGFFLNTQVKGIWNQSFMVTEGSVSDDRPPTSSGFSATTSQNQPLQMSITSLMSPVNDPDGQQVVLAWLDSLSTNGGVVVADSTNVVYTPNVDFVGADSFAYLVKDSLGVTSMAFAQIAVLPPGILVNTLQTPVVTSNSVSFNFIGLPGKTYQVQRAQSPAGPWDILGAMAMQPNGNSVFSDASPPVNSAFYRTLLLP